MHSTFTCFYRKRLVLPLVLAFLVTGVMSENSAQAMLRKIGPGKILKVAILGVLAIGSPWAGAQVINAPVDDFSGTTILNAIDAYLASLEREQSFCEHLTAHNKFPSAVPSSLQPTVKDQLNARMGGDPFPEVTRALEICTPPRQIFRQQRKSDWQEERARFVAKVYPGPSTRSSASHRSSTSLVNVTIHPTGLVEGDGSSMDFSTTGSVEVPEGEHLEPSLPFFSRVIADSGSKELSEAVRTVIANYSPDLYGVLGAQASRLFALGLVATAISQINSLVGSILSFQSVSSSDVSQQGQMTAVGVLNTVAQSFAIASSVILIDSNLLLDLGYETTGVMGRMQRAWFTFDYNALALRSASSTSGAGAASPALTHSGTRAPVDEISGTVILEAIDTFIASSELVEHFCDKTAHFGVFPSSVPVPLQPIVRAELIARLGSDPFPEIARALDTCSVTSRSLRRARLADWVRDRGRFVANFFPGPLPSHRESKELGDVKRLVIITYPTELYGAIGAVSSRLLALSFATLTASQINTLIATILSNFLQTSSPSQSMANVQSMANNMNISRESLVEAATTALNTAAQALAASASIIAADSGLQLEVAYDVASTIGRLQRRWGWRDLDEVLARQTAASSTGPAAAPSNLTGSTVNGSTGVDSSTAPAVSPPASETPAAGSGESSLEESLNPEPVQTSGAASRDGFCPRLMKFILSKFSWSKFSWKR